MSEHDSTCAWFSLANHSRWHVFDCFSKYADIEYRPGVYVAIGDGRPLYVGSAVSLRHRITDHGPFRHRMNEDDDLVVDTKWGSFGWFEVRFSYSRKFGDWAMRELRLIKRLRPILNVMHSGQYSTRVWNASRHEAQDF